MAVNNKIIASNDCITVMSCGERKQFHMVYMDAKSIELDIKLHLNFKKVGIMSCVGRITAFAK